MKLQKYIPKFPLNRYVESIMYLEGNNKGVAFPKTAMSLVFNLNDSFKLFTDSTFSNYVDYKKYWVAGFQTKPTYVENYGESKMLVIQFRTLGAHMFLKESLHYFTNNFIELDSIFNHNIDETWEQLQNAKSIKKQFFVCEKFLYTNLLACNFKYEKLLIVAEDILRKHDFVLINDVCSELNLSRKHLSHLFKEYLGVSPKMLSSLHRFQKIIKTISKSPSEKLTEVAYEFEYFDQAHFNNDFKRFTGLKPSEYANFSKYNAQLKLVPHFLPTEYW